MEQRLIKPTHHGTNAQVERMEREVKVATWKGYPYDDQDFLRMSLTGFVAPYNFACRLKTFSSFTPYEYICKIYISKPNYFILYPSHQMQGWNTCCCYKFRLCFLEALACVCIAVNLSFYKVSKSKIEGYSDKGSIEQQTAG